jgi:hypothetical protein
LAQQQSAGWLSTQGGQVTVDRAEVDKRIEAVETSYRHAIEQTEALLFRSSDQKHNQAALETSVRPLLSDWEVRGRKAADEQRAPMAKDGKSITWPQWIASGQSISDTLAMNFGGDELTLGEVVAKYANAAGSGLQKGLAGVGDTLGKAGTKAATGLLLALGVGLGIFLIARRL